MQNHSGELASQDDDEPGEQFSQPVEDYKKRVIDIIAWLFTQEEELSLGPPVEDLRGARFAELLDEYSKHDKFMTKFTEYCHVIMECKEDGQEMKDSDELLTDEDRDEVGIQLDAMVVCYEKLKILIYERLHNLRALLEDRQQTQIEQFEEWLSRAERQIANITSIGPDSDSVGRQLEEVDRLVSMLAKQQDVLNFISNVVSVIFDDVNPVSFQISSGCCSGMDAKLESINRRWEELCRLVDDRRTRLIQAQAIWKVLNIDGVQFSEGLKTIGRSLQEMFELANNVSEADDVFIGKLKARSLKTNDKISRQQSFYTMLEERIRREIEKISDPNDELCAPLIHELSSSLDCMQLDWDRMMRSKRTFEYKLQLLENPAWNQNYIEIDLANRDLNLESPGESQSSSKLFECSQSTGEELNICDSTSIRSPLHNNSSMSQQHDLSSAANTTSTMNNSQEEISIFSPLNSYPKDDAGNDHGTSNQYSTKQSRHEQRDNDVTNILKNRMHLSEQEHQQNYLPIECALPHNNNHGIEAHNCRVEEWKDSLENFSNWLLMTELFLDPSSSTRHSSSQNPYQQLVALHDIENRIRETRQDEFDCLLLQGSAIIEDLVPEMGADECEGNANKLKQMLSELELRYATVRKRLQDKKRDLLDASRWSGLSARLDLSCSYLIKQLGEVVPETSIGVDLVTLAQQQDRLERIRSEVGADEAIKSSLREAELFLEICDFLQTQLSNPHISSLNQTSPFIDDNTWTSFKKLKDDIEKRRDSVLIHFSELSQTIEERLQRLDRVHEEMHALQQQMQDLAAKLQLAEILRSNWAVVESLTIEELSEQLEDLESFRERVSEIEATRLSMNCIRDRMSESEIPLSQQNLNRISELNEVSNLILASVEERQKLIEQAFDNQSSSEQRFLNQTLSDMPRWERRVTTSKVPYFIDLETKKTHWDHPKFGELMRAMSGVNFIFSAYRTAVKLRILQRKLGVEMLMLEQLKVILDPELVNSPNVPQVTNANDTLIGVEQIIIYLKVIYEKVQAEENNSLDVPLSIDLTLNWLLNLYDSTRTGYISAISLKVGLALICCATREEKYVYMYELVASRGTASVDARNLGNLIENCMRIPTYLGEGESFGGSEIIESTVRNCFSMSKFNPQNPNSIDLNDYLTWLKAGPQFLAWLPILHRLHISEHLRHPVRCKLCGANPIIGLRYRCVSCIKFNICQACFLTGRHIHEHPVKHNIREYCSITSFGEDVKDLTKILKNKFRNR